LYDRNPADLTCRIFLRDGNRRLFWGRQPRRVIPLRPGFSGEAPGFYRFPVGGLRGTNDCRHIAIRVLDSFGPAWRRGRKGAPPSRSILGDKRTLATYRLTTPGSEFRHHQSQRGTLKTARLHPFCRDFAKAGGARSLVWKKFSSLRPHRHPSGTGAEQANDSRPRRTGKVRPGEGASAIGKGFTSAKIHGGALVDRDTWPENGPPRKR